MKQLLTYCVLLALFGCTPSEDAQHSHENDANLRLGVAHCCVEQDLYMWKMGKGVEDEAKHIGIQNIQFDTANGNQQTQFNQMKQMAENRTQAIIMSLVSDDTSDKPHQKKLFDFAESHNLPIVLYTISPRNLYLSEYNNVYYVGSIPAQSGIYQGQMIVKQWKQNPAWDRNGDGVIQYVILKGPHGNPDAEDRTKWVSATIENYPTEGIKAEEIALESAEFKRAEAKKVVESWIQSGVLERAEVLIANNDDMALGALDALAQYPVHLPVFGVDAIPEALQKIQNKQMAGTVLQDAQAQIRTTVALAANLAANRPPESGLDYQIVDRTVMIPYVAIDRDNIAQYLK